MGSIFVITAGEDFAQSLQRVLRYLRGIHAVSIVLPALVFSHHLTLWKPS